MQYYVFKARQHKAAGVKTKQNVKHYYYYYFFYFLFFLTPSVVKIPRVKSYRKIKN